MILLCSVFMLTGCFGSKEEEKEAHSLVCEMEEGTEKFHTIYTFNDTETELQKVNLDVYVTMPEGSSEDDIQVTKDMLNHNCQNFVFESCNVTVDDNVIKYSVVATPDQMDLERNKTLKEIKEQVTSEGYSCK